MKGNYSRYYQRKVAVINDVTGFGRCAAAVALPVLSAMKLQACVLPTAILSMHTGYPSYVFQDFTPYMAAYMDNWKQHGLQFEGISTGFLGSLEQIDLVVQFLEDFSESSKTKVIVDPVMGDHGKIYSSYTKEMCIAMRRLLPYADVITPNLTEACQLVGWDYTKTLQLWESQGEKALLPLMKALSEAGASKIVITGMEVLREDQIANLLYDSASGEMKLLRTRRIGIERCGTGDIFAAVLTGALVNELSLEQAVILAAEFISQAAALTQSLNLPPEDGLCFEEYLGQLSGKIPSGIVTTNEVDTVNQTDRPDDIGQRA